MPKYYKSRAWMYKRWVVDRKTTEEMAKECGCTQETINSYLNQFGLKSTRKK